MKKKYVPLDSIFDLREKKFITWVDKLGFGHIFILWIIVIVLFGVTFHFMHIAGSEVVYNVDGKEVNGIFDSIYFSFITATSTGFGDIVPMGWLKLIAVIEVIFGMILLALVTSKLVSIKQDVILNEIYEISFNERINRLRSSLLLFRQHVSRLIGKVEAGNIKKREINDIYMQFSLLEDVLNEMLSMFNISENPIFRKGPDAVSTELLVNSILNSFERLYELIVLLNSNEKEWKRNITVNMISRSIEVIDSLFDRLENTRFIDQTKFKDFMKQKEQLVKEIKKELE